MRGRRWTSAQNLGPATHLPRLAREALAAAETGVVSGSTTSPAPPPAPISIGGSRPTTATAADIFRAHLTGEPAYPPIFST